MSGELANDEDESEKGNDNKISDFLRDLPKGSDIRHIDVPQRLSEPGLFGRDIFG